MATPIRIIFIPVILIMLTVSAHAAAIDDAPPPQTNVISAVDPRHRVIEIEIHDPHGKQLPGANVSITIHNESQPHRVQPAVRNSVTDQNGRARVDLLLPTLTIPPETFARVWAHKPELGNALVTIVLREIVFSKAAPEPPFCIPLEKPANRTITVLDADHNPVADALIAPRVLREGKNGDLLSVPDDWINHWTVTTNANGEATFRDLPPKWELLGVQVKARGIAPHTLPVTENAANATLELGPTGGRLVGVVRDESSQPIPAASIEVWVRATGTSPTFMINQNAVPTSRVLFDSQPLLTSSQGAFQTPPMLLGGSTYRVAIRQQGFAPFFSQWQPMAGARAVVPPIRLKPLRKISGQVLDRQHHPIPGATIFLAAGGPSTVTSPEGRFTLSNLVPDKTILLVQHPSFRLQGWPADPVSQTAELMLNPVRLTEQPDRQMTPLDEPIPEAESRALALRVFAPYLAQVLEQGNEHQKSRAISTLAEVDPSSVLELLNQGIIKEGRLSDEIRLDAAIKIAAIDPAKAESVIEAIASPALRATAPVYLLWFAPRDAIDWKRQFIDKAIPIIRDGPNPAGVRAAALAALAGLSLEIGAHERARGLLQEAMQPLAPHPEAKRERPRANQVAAWIRQLEHDLALAETQNVQVDPRPKIWSLILEGIAFDQPALAQGLVTSTNFDAQRINRPPAHFYRLALDDLNRARSLAASIDDPAERSTAWAYMALALAKKAPPASKEAIDRAIEAIDTLRSLTSVSQCRTAPSNLRSIHLTNPAAFILPIVERIAPDRLEEVFWRAVALHPHVDAQNENLLHGSAIGDECTLLARYDRSVAAILFQPIDKHLQSLITSNSEISGFHASSLIAKSCLDPQAAVALVEALPQPRQLSPWKPISIARVNLAITLGQPAKTRWQWRWQQLGAPMPLAD